MAESIGALRAELSAGHAQFESDMKKARDAVASNANGMVTAMNKVKDGFRDTQNSISGLQSMAKGAMGMIGGYISIGAIKQLSEMGAKALQTETAFKNATDGMKIDADEWVAALKKATKGTVDESDLMQKAMKGITGGLSQEQITKIAEFSTTAAIRMGIDVSEAYASIVDAVEMMRTKTLVKFGLITKAQAEVAESAKNAGVEVDMFRIIMENTANQNTLIGSLDETALKFQQVKAASKDFWESLGKETAKAVGDIYEVAQNIKLLFTKEGREALQQKANEKLSRLAMDQVYAPGPNSPRGELSTPYLDSLKGAEERKKAADAARKQAETIQKVIESLKFEYEQLQRTDQEQAVYNALKSAGVSANSKAGETIAQLAARNFDVAQAIKASRMEAEEWLQQIEEAEKERQKNLDALAAEISALKQEAETFNMSAKEATLYKLALKGATEEQLLFADTYLTAIEKMTAIKRITEELITPQEKYNATVAELKSLLDSFGITWDQYVLGMQKAKDTLDSATKDQKDQLTELQKAIEGWGKSSADAIVDFAMTGKTSFSDMIQSMIADILKMLVYQKMIKPLFDFLGGSLGTGSWAGSFFGSSTPTGSTQAVKALSDTGGLAGDFNVTVINNKSDAQITTTKKQGPRGPELEVLVDQLVAKKIGEFGSSSNKMIRQNFDTSQRLVTR